MMVTKLVADGKTKTKIYLDESYAGWLWNRQLSDYGIEERAELSEAAWESVLNDVILPRGKKKALDLLLFQERAEKELEDKLVQDGYTGSQTASVMEYVHRYPYLDDVRYASHVFRAHYGTKSNREIRFLLSQKGVSDRDAEAGYEQYLSELAEEGREEPDNPELAAIRSIVSKKLRKSEHPERQEIQKLSASLARKGFGYDNIRKVMAEFSEELPED